VGIKKIFNIIGSSAQVISDKVVNKADELRNDLYEKEKAHREKVKSKNNSTKKLFSLLTKIQNNPANTVDIYIRVYCAPWRNSYEAKEYLEILKNQKMPFLGYPFKELDNQKNHWHSDVNNYLKKDGAYRVDIYKIEATFYKVKKTNTFLSLGIEVFTKKDLHEDVSASGRIEEHNKTILSKESSLEIYSPTPKELALFLPLFGHQQFEKLQEVIDKCYLFSKPRLYLKGKLNKSK